jgi:hypothetical protein
MGLSCLTLCNLRMACRRSRGKPCPAPMDVPGLPVRGARREWTHLTPAASQPYQTRHSTAGFLF